MVCLPFYSTHNLIHDLDQVLGQQTNRRKSTLTLARQLLEDERASCFCTLVQYWYSVIRISSRERVIGMFIGIHVSFLDSCIAVHKFDLAPLQKHLLVREQLCVTRGFLGACMFFVTARGCLSYNLFLSPCSFCVLLRALRLPGSSFYLCCSFCVLPNNSFAFFCGTHCPQQCAHVCDCPSVLLTLWVFIIDSYDQHESSDILISDR